MISLWKVTYICECRDRLVLTRSCLLISVTERGKRRKLKGRVRGLCRLILFGKVVICRKNLVVSVKVVLFYFREVTSKSIGLIRILTVRCFNTLPSDRHVIWVITSMINFATFRIYMLSFKKIKYGPTFIDDITVFLIALGAWSNPN